MSRSDTYSMRALDELIRLAPPPATPAGAPFDWDAVAAKLGTALPADYVAFCDVYGHGTFYNGWLWAPLTPFTHHKEDDLAGTYWRDLLVDGRDEHPPFPRPRGVLPFAYCELKHMFWWQPDGPVDSWPVLVGDDAGGWARFEEPATAVLLRAFRRTLFGGVAHEEELVFSSAGPPTPRPSSQPFVIRSYGTERDGRDAPERHHVELDLGGGLGGTRQARLDELLAALEPALRDRILTASAMRSKEVLEVRSREDIDAICAAVQAWADRVSGWS